MTELVFPRLAPVSDRALLVEFGAYVDEAVHDKVLAFDAALRFAVIPGLVESVPAMVNLLVVFDPLQTDHDAVGKSVRSLLGRMSRTSRSMTEHEVEVCYDDGFGRDLAAVSEKTGLPIDSVIAAHLSGDYSVFMYGFAPGYAYLSGVPEGIQLPRKAAPVRNVPAGSVIIAGGQCLITTLTMPTGWWVIGRSPARILTGDERKPFLFEVGDSVRFRRVGPDALPAGAGT